MYWKVTLGSHSIHLHNWFLDMSFHHLQPSRKGKNLHNPLKSSVLQFLNLFLKVNFHLWCRNQRFWIFAAFKSSKIHWHSIWRIYFQMTKCSWFLSIIHKFISEVEQYMRTHTYVSIRRTSQFIIFSRLSVDMKPSHFKRMSQE